MGDIFHFSQHGSESFSGPDLEPLETNLAAYSPLLTFIALMQP